MTYALGAKSQANLAGVHPDLRKIINRAIAISTQDFGVTEPQVRTIEDQRKKVAAGVSQTMKSKHLEQPDLTGKTKILYGHAVDLVPWVNGAFSWDWERIYPVAAAMVAAAAEMGLADHLCWGGVWDRWMSTYAGDAAAIKAAEQAYCVRHPGKDFVDGPHFQIYRVG